MTPLQAFRAGTNAYGLLFHLEVTEPQVRDMVRTFEGELATAKIPGAPIVEGSPPT